MLALRAEKRAFRMRDVAESLLVLCLDQSCDQESGCQKAVRHVLLPGFDVLVKL